MDKSRGDIKARASRLSGQVAGIGRMIDEDRYCIDILRQIAAARSALDALGLQLLTAHLESCVLGHGTPSAHAETTEMSREQMLSEVRTVLASFLK